MTKKLARALLATATLAIAALSTNSADAAYHRHITSHHFGKYLAARHFHYYHRHFHHDQAPSRVARRHEPPFRQFRENCLYTHGHLARCAPAELRVHYQTRNKPSCFWTAASMGGPCGCWAANFLLGITAHVWQGHNLWLARAWFDFEHVAPAPMTATVTTGHVAPVIAVKVINNRQMALLHDSWADHWVPTAGRTFVRPPGVKRHVRTAALEAGPTGPSELAFALMPR